MQARLDSIDQCVRDIDLLPRTATINTTQDAGGRGGMDYIRILGGYREALYVLKVGMNGRG